METKRIISLIGVCLLVTLGGCSTGDATDTFPDSMDAIAIYAAVIRQVVETDDTFGGALEKPVVYVLNKTSDAAGDPSITQAESVELSADVQAGINEALSDLSSPIEWIEDREQLAFDESGGIVGGGVIVTLGNIHAQQNGEVQVAGSIYVASLAAGGQTYILEKQGDEWVITGNTGVEWIS